MIKYTEYFFDIQTAVKEKPPMYNFLSIFPKEGKNNFLNYGIIPLSASHGNSSATELIFLTKDSALPTNGGIKYLTMNPSPIYKLNHKFVLNINIKEPSNELPGSFSHFSMFEILFCYFYCLFLTFAFK